MTGERALTGVAVAIADDTASVPELLRAAGAVVLVGADPDVLVSGRADIAIGRPGDWTSSPTTVAITPSEGTLSSTGTTVFANTLTAANAALTVLAATAHRPWPTDARLAAPPGPTIAVPAEPTDLDEASRAALAAAVERLRHGGARAVPSGEGLGEHGVDAALALTAPPALDVDACSVTVPCGSGHLTVLARRFDDAVALDVAALITNVAAPQHVWPLSAAEHAELVVFGAHLRGGALAHQLTDLGARWVGDITTSDRYRMTRLPTTPPKPAVTRVPDSAVGTKIRAERWLLSPAALGRFLVALPAPMQLGKVEFDDGSWRTSFGCDGVAADAGEDISRYGGWAAAIAAGAV